MGKNRLAIVDPSKCFSTKCNKECVSSCPVNSMGKECVTLVDIEDITGKIKKVANISETLCLSACNICIKRCPYDAIYIVNVPSEIGEFITHRYATSGVNNITPNGFRLYRMPAVKPSNILGIIGQNGVGKSTIVNILSLSLIHISEPTRPY